MMFPGNGRRSTRKPLHGAEDKRAILPQGTSEGESVTVVVERRFGLAATLQKKVVLGHAFVAVVVIRVAAVAVRATLHGYVDRRASRPTLLRIEGCRFNLEFLDGARGRYVGRSRQCGALAMRLIGRAVDRIGVGDRPTRRREFIDRAVVERPEVQLIAERHDTGREPCEDQRISIGERHHLDALLVDHLSCRTGGRLQNRRFGGDRHGLRKGADFHRRIDHNSIVDAHLHDVAFR